MSSSKHSNKYHGVENPYGRSSNRTSSSSSSSSSSHNRPSSSSSSHHRPSSSSSSHNRPSSSSSNHRPSSSSSSRPSSSSNRPSSTSTSRYPAGYPAAPNGHHPPPSGYPPNAGYPPPPPQPSAPRPAQNYPYAGHAPYAGGAAAGYAGYQQQQGYAQGQYAGYGQGAQYAPYGQHPQQGYAQPQQPGAGLEMLSWTPSGRKRALLVGINYTKVDGGRNRLRGCVNDVKMMKYLLTSKFGFRNSDFWIMTDDNPQMSHDVRTSMPTKMNILSGMRWLVSNTHPGDSLFFHFSGHGSQQRDYSGDEADGMDETILPLDHRTAGHIIDDQIFDIMVRPLPAHVRLTSVMDCCHSGTGMDLPYVHLAGTESYQGFPMFGMSRDASATGRGPFKKGGMKLLMDMLDAAATGSGLGVPGMGPGMGRPQPVPRPVSAGEVILFSGCADNQTSADVTPQGGQSVSSGAMTYSFIEAIEHGTVSTWQSYTYRTLCSAMRTKLRNKGYKQIPQLSTSRPFDLNSAFRV